MSEEFDIEELLQLHLSDEQETVPEDLFPAIDATILARQKRKKRRFIWWWLLGGIGLFSFGILIGTQASEACQCDNGGMNGKALHPYIQQLHRNAPRKNVDITLEELTLFTQQNGATGLQTPQENSNKHESNNPTHSANFQLLETTKDFTTIQPQQPTGFTQKSDPTVATISPTKTDAKGTNLVEDQFPTKSDHNVETAIRIDSSNNSTQTDLLAANHEMDTLLSIPDSVKKIPLALAGIPFSPIPNPPITVPQSSLKNSKLGLMAYTGPSFYNLSLFKPYFESGQLSNSEMQTGSFEAGFGLYRKLSDRFRLQVFADYSSKKSGFTYDLMVGESDYFDFYLQDEPIPLENLDDPNSCNCFLVEDVNLDYQISVINLNLGAAFTWFKLSRFKLNSTLNIGSNLLTSYKGNNLQVVDFPSANSERFNTFRLNFGTGISYQVVKQMEIGLQPSFSFVRLNESAFFAQSYHEFIVPFHLWFSF